MVLLLACVVYSLKCFVICYQAGDENVTHVSCHLKFAKADERMVDIVRRNAGLSTSEVYIVFCFYSSVISSAVMC